MNPAPPTTNERILFAYPDPVSCASQAALRQPGKPSNQGARPAGETCEAGAIVPPNGMLGDSTIRTESSRWQRAYSDSRLARRRASTHKRKLSQLGCFSLPRTARILDVPCGTGEALRILHQAGFTDLTGSDITADPKLAAEKWARIDCADAVSLPYDSGSFDAVISMHSLHHLGGAVRIGRAFDEWLPVIRPGGRLMIIDHYDSLQLRAAFWGLQRPWLTWPTHGLRTLREQLEE